ncbi:MAG: hypothetical protein GC193_06260 [Cryomorphaceae bacterium]|nr:hypothetical protein [Cryomorphaceae bacterium]
MIKRIIFLFIGVLLTSVCFAQDDIALSIDNISVKTQDGVFSGGSQIVTLRKKKTVPVLLYNGTGTSISVKMRIRPYVSSNQHKDGGIQIRMNYFCTHNGRTRKVKTTRVFFAESSRQFQEEQTFIFDHGLRNSRVDVSYMGSMPR